MTAVKKLFETRAKGRAETRHVIATKLHPGGRAGISAQPEIRCAIGQKDSQTVRCFHYFRRRKFKIICDALMFP